MKAERVWLIEGWDSDERILSLKVDARRIGFRQVPWLLTALAAKHGRLTDDELVRCYVKRDRRHGDRDGDPFLHVYWDAGAGAFLCGESVHFSARLVEFTNGDAPGVRLRAILASPPELDRLRAVLLNTTYGRDQIGVRDRCRIRADRRNRCSSRADG